MLRKIAHRLTKKPMVVLIVALIALAFSFIGAAATRINYDILTYLPPDFDSSKGEKLLEEPFHSAATTMLIVEDMPPEYTNALCRKIQDVPGVSSALWISSLTGVQIPEDFLPEEIRDIFFAGDSTMMIVQYEMPGSSTETMNAIRDIRNICNEKCFLAGFSVVIKDTKDLVDSELPFYVLLAVALSLIVMCATMESWILPFAVLGSIGFAIMFNFGTNIFLGEISYITKAIAAVLQLGVTTDYSIFLYHRYIEECEKTDNHKDAMAEAIVSSFTALASSSLTTVAGFLALCFMQLLLGRDIGIVMAKGVVLGIVTVLLVLPAIILVFDKPIEKYKHRALDIRFEKFNRFIVKHNKAFVVLFILLFIPALYSQSHAEVYYKLDEALPQDMPSIVATNKLKDEYNMASSHFVVMRDDFSHSEMLRLIDELEAVDGVETVVAYDKFASNAIPEFFIPDELREICKQDGMQIMMINSAYPSASDEVGVQVEALNKILKAYDTNAYMTGEAVLTKDLIDTASVDFEVTNYLSIIAILVIVCFAFKSLSVPVLLVAAIELAICINQGVPYFEGVAIPFINSTVIGCVQLGATVDYAILMTTRFRDELQSGKSAKEAALTAATMSDASIISSALVLFCATLGVGLVSRIEIISGICMMLARGSLISACVILFLLPAILAAFEPIIAKTTLHWRKPKVKKSRADRASAQ